MQAFDEDFNLTKEYYKELEAIVASKPVHSKRWYFEYIYDSGMQGPEIDAFLLSHQVLVPFANGLAFIFDNHIAPGLEAEQADELRPLFQPYDAAEYEDDSASVTNAFADDPELQAKFATLEAMDDDVSDDEFDKATEEAGKLLLEKAESQFSGYLFLYWKLMKILEPKEIRLMDSLLQRPVAQRIVTKAWEEFVEAEGMKTDSKPFALPDDFFKQDWDDNNPKEHFYIKGKIKARGPLVFAQFINYLADCGYISNDDEVKSLLAFRLTGRCRPQGELPLIQWNGKNGKSYELIYIIRYFTDRGNYKKMRQFFTGPEWVKDRDSCYAHAADSEFRRFMVQLYPEVCLFKK